MQPLAVSPFCCRQSPRLEQYAAYCASQFEGKDVLDSKKQDPAFEDFLERCRDSPFSRKLDLWSFLGNTSAPLIYASFRSFD